MFAIKKHHPWENLSRTCVDVWSLFKLVKITIVILAEYNISLASARIN